jgi:hypothetical protein
VPNADFMPNHLTKNQNGGQSWSNANVLLLVVRAKKSRSVRAVQFGAKNENNQLLQQMIKSDL